MNYDKIGNFIATKRKEKDLTQKDLANKLGVTDKAVSKWERGLGCPDVSILELLSKALDVSILEILKGRIIEDEIIKVTEMNDYVKETVDYSNYTNKEKMKSLLSKMLSIFIIIVGSFLIILNFEHIIYLNKKYEYDFDKENIYNLHKTINKIEENIDIIKHNQGIFNLEDYQMLINHLDSSYNDYKNITLLKYSGVKKFNINDIYMLDLYVPPVIKPIAIFRILEKYNENIKGFENLYRDIFLAMASNESLQIYDYKILNFFDLLGINNNIADVYRINQIIYCYSGLIDSYYYLTELIIEVGGLNE